MPEELRLLATALTLLRGVWSCHRPDHGPRSDAGYSTESVLVTAVLVGVALTALAVLADKIIARANSINL